MHFFLFPALKSPGVSEISLLCLFGRVQILNGGSVTWGFSLPLTPPPLPLLPKSKIKTSYHLDTKVHKKFLHL